MTIPTNTVQNVEGGYQLNDNHFNPFLEINYAENFEPYPINHAFAIPHCLALYEEVRSFIDSGGCVAHATVVGIIPTEAYDGSIIPQYWLRINGQLMPGLYHHYYLSLFNQVPANHE